MEENYKKKGMKINEDFLIELWMLNTPTFILQASQEEKRERKDKRKYLKNYSKLKY